MKEHLSKVNNEYIRYANCWEDADLLLDLLDVQCGDKVLSIGSAGDNSFSLLTANPSRVIAVDINPTQLKLISLKKAAFKALEYQEFLEFLGFRNHENRMAYFKRIKVYLREEDIRFWNDRCKLIDSGIIHQGKFENYFKTFRQNILPLIHSKDTIQRLMSLKSKEDQASFYENTWNSWRWRKLFKIFFSKILMGILGRDPSFLEEVKIPVSQFIINQATKELSSTSCQSNYFLDFILKGQFQNTLPHYARGENYSLIKANLDKLQVFKGYTDDAISKYGTFDKFNLSNIFEYMDSETFQSVVDNLVKNGTAHAKYVYWNLMVPRSMHTIDKKLTSHNTVNNTDRGFFYSAVHLNQK